MEAFGQSPSSAPDTATGIPFKVILGSNPWQPPPSRLAGVAGMARPPGLASAMPSAEVPTQPGPSFLLQAPTVEAPELHTQPGPFPPLSPGPHHQTRCQRGSPARGMEPQLASWWLSSGPPPLLLLVGGWADRHPGIVTGALRDWASKSGGCRQRPLAGQAEPSYHQARHSAALSQPLGIRRPGPRARRCWAWPCRSSPSLLEA